MSRHENVASDAAPMHAMDFARIANEPPIIPAEHRADGGRSCCPSEATAGGSQPNPSLWLTQLIGTAGSDAINLRKEDRVRAVDEFPSSAPLRRRDSVLGSGSHCAHVGVDATGDDLANLRDKSPAEGQTSNDHCRHNVVSETQKPTPDPKVMAWLDSLDPTTTYLTAITARQA